MPHSIWGCFTYVAPRAPGYLMLLLFLFCIYFGLSAQWGHVTVNRSKLWGALPTVGKAESVTTSLYI